MDEYQKYCGTANTIGVPFQVISPQEVPTAVALGRIGQRRRYAEYRRRAVSPRRWTYRARRSHHGAAQGSAHPRRGDLRAKRSDGGDAHASGEWQITTNKGNIIAEHVVCATGNYARQTGRLFGLNVPSIPVEHQYIVYDESPELKAYRQGGGRELAVLRESDQSYYLREERMGWILGPYEAGAPARFADGVPDWFGKSLFEGDLERLLPHVEAAQRRVPSLATCGIKDIVNGPIAYTPDGSPLIGPAWGARNLWLNEGHSFGITAAGGSGWQLAEWIVEGEPGIDMMAVDPRRYGPYTSKRYVVQKNEETYRNVFVIHFPDEERADARPAKTSPVYDKLARMGAVFGQRYGWERANWFAPPGVEAKGQMELPALQLFSACGQRGAAHP
jgi:dimethylglycine dehydrogenase